MSVLFISPRTWRRLMEWTHWPSLRGSACAWGEHSVRVGAHGCCVDASVPHATHVVSACCSRSSMNGHYTGRLYPSLCRTPLARTLQ
eukprot:8314941-Alexandrium_andersonii.AAC.1